MTLLVELSDKREFVDIVRRLYRAIRQFSIESAPETILFWREAAVEGGVEVIYLVPLKPPDSDWVVWRCRERVPPEAVGESVESTLAEVGLDRALKVNSLKVDGEELAK
ncbi:MAG: hypothetical protein DRO06_02510 [Thermoproteota archaeon]|nr:MAG: hypothetical protein DRO06_02510 [Candidatus Korarchaeota archaeon]